MAHGKTKKGGLQTPLQLSLGHMTFGVNFLAQHAGRVISDPQVAIVELVANAWDAGSDRVAITWPSEAKQILAVEDNGTGMSKDEFAFRWNMLSYNRVEFQGTEVQFPQGVRHRRRSAFGRNGIGRHAMFCFSKEYFVETKRDGKLRSYRIRRGSGPRPFDVESVVDRDELGHGTKIWAKIETPTLQPTAIAELIGSRFVADPDFQILVNGQAVKLTDLEHLCERFDVPVENVGTVLVRRFDSERAARVSKQHGVAFWVNRRLVGTPSWELDRSLLDARTAVAKRFTYVVEVDMLADDVKADWTGFHASERSNAVRRAITEFVADDLRGLTHDLRRERKRIALEENRTALRRLPPLAQEAVATFAEEIQERCPTIAERDITNIVTILSKMEMARSGYALLEKLATLQPQDFDKLGGILEQWTVSDVKRVMGELRYRLELIAQLEKLIDKSSTDELHDLQPLFEHGLWIFGPEFESVSFTSNRTLATVVERFFGEAALTTPRKRPDFIVLPDSSIGIYSCDAFDERHEVMGYSTVVVVELKRGGFQISFQEKDQALNYARQLRKSGKVGPHTKLICHVLGSSVETEASEPHTEGPISVLPRSYGVLLRQAHARTYNLLRQIESAAKWAPEDPDLKAVLERDALPLFDHAN